MQDTKSDLEQLITPTFFKEGKPLSQADIYDFIENLITKGEASANTSKVIDLLPELRNKERAYNAFNNQSTQTKEPQQLLVSKENLHTEPKAQEPNPFTTPTPKQATKASEQSQEPNLFTAQDPAAPKEPVQEAQTQAPQTREQIKARLAQEEKEAITQLRSELLADYNQKVAQIKANKKLSEAKQQEKIKDLQAKNNSLFMRKSNEIYTEFEQKATQALQDLQSLENTKKIDRVDEFADRFFLSYERDKAIALNNRYNEIIESSEFKEATQRHTQLSEKELDEIAIHFARYSKENEKFSDDAIKTFAQELAQELSQTQKSFNMLDFKDSILTDKQIVGNSRKQKQFLENKRQKIQRHLNTTPIKEFGTNYAEFYKDGTGAIGKILAESKDYEARKKAGELSQKEREQGAYKGQVAGAFYKEGLGDIDLVWGEITDPKNHKGYGLAHILDKHPDFDIRLIPEIIEKGNLINQNNIRYRIEKDNYVIGLSAEYKGDKRNFIITAFEKNKDKRDTFTERPFTSTSDNAVKNLDKKENAESLYASSAITKGETLPLNSKDNFTIKEQSKQHKGQEELKNIFDEFEQQDKTLQDKAKLLKEHKEDLRSKDLVGSEKWEDLIKQQSLLIDEESQILERAYKKAKRLMPHFSSYEEILQYEPINSVSLRLLKENVNDIMDKEIRALQDTSITKADFKQALDEFNTFYKEYRDYHKPLYYEFETKFGFYTREFNKNKLSNAKDVEMFKKHFLDKKPSEFNDKLKQVYETIQQYNQLELQNRQRIHDSKESELIKSKAIEIKEQLNNKYKNSIQKQEISKQSENPHAQNFDQKKTKGKIPDEIKGDTTNLSAYSGEFKGELTSSHPPFAKNPAANELKSQGENSKFLGDKATGELKQEIENLRKEINDLQKKRMDEEEAHPKAKELDRLRDEYYDEFSKAQTKEQKEIIREKYYSKIDPLANEIDNELPSHKKIIEKQKELNNAQEILEAKEKAIQEAKLKADPKMLEKESNARKARASLTTIRNNPEDVLSEERYFDNARLLDKNFRANTHRWARENGLKDEINTARRFIIGEAERNEAIQRATDLQGELITKQRNYFSARLAKQRAELEKELDITPIKEFGTNYAEFYHAGGDAVKKLLLEKQGQVAGAFYKDSLGDIDLVWGGF